MEVLVACFYLLMLYIVYRLIDYLLYLPRISKRPESLYVLVTGCDTGFGNAAAKRLDGMGCHVIAGCLTEAGETDLRKSCSEKLKTIQMDVSKPESVQKAFEFVTNCLPSGSGLWGVINNAGIFGQDGAEDWRNMEDYYKVNAVNLFGLIDVTKTFLPLVKKAKGRVVNTASIAGRVAVVGAPYTVSKFGVEAFSDCMRREMKKFGVSFHLIEPGFFKTNIVKMDQRRMNAIWNVYKGLPQSTKEEYGEEFTKQLIEDMKGIETSGFLNEDITPVIDAYIHALMAVFPRARYAVGKDAKIWLTIQTLPEWLGDWIFMKLLGGKRILPAALRKK